MTTYDKIDLPPLPSPFGIVDPMGSGEKNYTLKDMGDYARAYARAAIATYQQGGNAKQHYDEIMKNDTEEPDPIEDLRFFCSFAMRQQDWLDVEPFFDALIADRKRRGEPVAWRWSESNGERWFDWTTDWSHHDRAAKMGCLIEYAAPSAPQPAESCASLMSDKTACGSENGDCDSQPADPVKPHLSVSYDAHVDCLYVDCNDSDEPFDAEEDDKGILYRRAISDGRLVGITIMNFMGQSRYGKGTP